MEFWDKNYRYLSAQYIHVIVLNTFRLSANVHILNIRKLRLRESKCVQGHTAKLQSDLDLN